jgi:hypothetical protein
MNKRVLILLFDVFINVLLPVLIGVFFYRFPFANEHSIFKNYVPDALWAYALTSSIFIIWNRLVNYLWLSFVILFFIVYEILQYLHFTKGTGDVWDVVTYLTSTFIAIIINKFVKFYFYKPNTTV